MSKRQTALLGLLVAAVLVAGGYAVHVQSQPETQRDDDDGPAIDDIEIEPPGSRASARAGIEGERYAWFLWVFRRTVIVPGKWETSEGGRRIHFDAARGTKYALSLLVTRGDELQTYQRLWEYDAPPDPGPDPDPDPDPDPPPPGPDLTGLALEAHSWAQVLPAPAKEQGPALGGIFRLVGGKLSRGEYPPAGGDWGAQVNAAHQDIEGRAKQIFLKPEWDSWQAKYAARMGELWNAGRFHSAKDVGAAMGEIATGLEAVKVGVILGPVPNGTQPSWRIDFD